MHLQVTLGGWQYWWPWPGSGVGGREGGREEGRDDGSCIIVIA